MRWSGINYIIALSLLLCTCNDSQNAYVEEDKVALLVELAFTKEPSEEVQNVFFKLHKTLNFEELNLFDHLSLERMTEEQVRRDSSHGAIAIENFNKIKAYRLALNTLSMTRYNKPYNQLERLLFNSLLEEVYQTGAFETKAYPLNEQVEIQREITDCSKVCFPRYLSFEPAASSGITSESYQLMIRCEEMECDYQFSFPCASCTTISSSNMLLALWMQSGNAVARDTPGYTRVSIRKNIIDAAGGPQWCSQYIQLLL